MREGTLPRLFSFHTQEAYMRAKILVCDDEIHIVRAVQFKLVQAGYDVRYAANGEEGWEAINRDPPDLLITDYQMPKLNGLELIERLQQRADTRRLPVIVLSAKGFELSSQELSERWGVLGVMDKPFSPRELLRLVEAGLAEKTAPAAC
jgi:two-component system alkaline phosphatase synthesis response regulator PhoP